MKYSVKLETREMCLQIVVLEGNMEILKLIIFLSLSLGEPFIIFRLQFLKSLVVQEFNELSNL